MKAPYDLEPDDEWVEGAAHFNIFDLDMVYQKILEFKDKIYKKFKKSKTDSLDEIAPEVREDCKPGDEMTQELTDAWNLFTRVRIQKVSSKYPIQIEHFRVLVKFPANKSDTFFGYWDKIQQRTTLSRWL